MKYTIAIDNGVTGSICIMDEQGQILVYAPTPVFKSLNYTKAVGYSSRIDSQRLIGLLKPYGQNCTVLLERPMVNPQRWAASVSAIRCDEATRSIIELLGLKLIYVDSKEWQTPMLPTRPAIPKAKKDATPAEKKALKAKRAAFTLETKALSLAAGQRLFPGVEFKKDADAALLAEWGRREKL